MMCVVVVMAASDSTTPEPDKKYTGRKITVEFQDADIRKFFELLAGLADKKLIIGDNITGIITMEHDAVPWDQLFDIACAQEALDCSLDASGHMIVSSSNPQSKKHPKEKAISERPPPKGMVLVPEGWFMMGCVPGDEYCKGDEKPRKKVFVNAFYMDIHEVTVSEYGLCAQTGYCREAEVSSKKKEDLPPYFNWNKSDRAEHPVNGVDWYQANAYCRWKGKRLPRETEFEYALRGGYKGKIYPWGNSSTPPSRYSNYFDETSKKATGLAWAYFKGYNDKWATTSPVCSMRKNPYGLCDISGNVSEWCQECYEADLNSTMKEQNSDNAQDNTKCVVRGGDAFNIPKSVRASARPRWNESIGIDSIGFRCAKDIPKLINQEATGGENEGE